MTSIDPACSVGAWLVPARCPPSPPSLACLGLGLTGPLRSRSYQHPLARARPRAAPNTMIMWAALTSLLLLTGANAAAPAAGAVAFGAAPGDRSMLHGHGTIPCTLECSINHALSSPPCPMISARHALSLRLCCACVTRACVWLCAPAAAAADDSLSDPTATADDLSHNGLVDGYPPPPPHKCEDWCVALRHCPTPSTQPSTRV